MGKNPIKNLLQRLEPWDSEILFFNADEYFDTILSAIKQAKESICIECYIFANDSLGEQIINALLQAASRGVRIKISLDGVGSLNWETDKIKKLTIAGIQVKIYHPLPWRLSHFGKTEYSNIIAKLTYLTLKINRRNHRKLYIIDRKHAWSGSMNISTSHLTHSVGGNNWIDAGVKITGAPVLELSNNFDDIWNNRKRYKTNNIQLPFRTNNNFIKRHQKNAELIRLIRSAKKRIWIVSAYLAPSKRIVRALKEAKQNGVDVTLLISHQSDVNFFPLVSTIYYKDFLTSGIKIYEYHQQIIHAKTMLLDDLLFIGSSNLNHRSFLHDLELDIILKQTESIQNAQLYFEKLVSNATRVTTANLLTQSISRTILGKLIWLVRYWI